MLLIGADDAVQLAYTLRAVLIGGKILLDDSLPIGRQEPEAEVEIQFVQSPAGLAKELVLGVTVAQFCRNGA